MVNYLNRVKVTILEGKYDKHGRLPIHPNEVRLILLTHGDFDHVGSAKDLKALTGAKIAIHEHDRLSFGSDQGCRYLQRTLKRSKKVGNHLSNKRPKRFTQLMEIHFLWTS